MSSSEVKVGAFALGGAVVLAGIITFMGAFSFGTPLPTAARAVQPCACCSRSPCCSRRAPG